MAVTDYADLATGGTTVTIHALPTAEITIVKWTQESVCLVLQANGDTRVSMRASPTAWIPHVTYLPEAVINAAKTVIVGTTASKVTFLLHIRYIHTSTYNWSFAVYFIVV